MALATDTNRVQIRIVEESTFGTTPTSPAMNVLRYTGAPRLGLENRHVTSNEIQSTRNVSSAVLVDQEMAGDINFELSFNALTIPIEGVLYSDWVTQPTIVNATADTEISDVDSATDTYTVASGGASFLQYHLVYCTNFTNSENNGLHAVASSSATTIVVGDGLVSESSVPVNARIRVVGIQGASGDLIAASGGTLTATLIDFTDFAIAVGDWVRIGGEGSPYEFATAACNGWCRVSAITATTLTFDIYPSGYTNDAGSSKTVQVFIGDKITNSTTAKSYTIEEQFQDHASVEYNVMVGCRINTMNFELPQTDLAKGSFSIMGKTGTIGTSAISGATNVAAATNDPFNTTSQVGALAFDGTEIDAAAVNYVLSSNININNNMRRQTAIGTLGAVGIGAGKCDVTGNLQMYFGDRTYIAYANADTELVYTVRLDDGANHGFLIDLPCVKLTGGVPDVSGPDADVTVDFPFIATKDSTLAYTIKIQQFHYIP